MWFRLFIFTFCVYSGITKVSNDYFLTKCMCSNDKEVNCDFQDLNKKKLKQLVQILISNQISCFQHNNGSITPTYINSKNINKHTSNSKIVDTSGEVSVINIQDKKNKANNCQSDGLSCTLIGSGIQLMYPTQFLAASLIVDSKTKMYNELIKKTMLDLEKEDSGCPFNLHGGFRSKDGFLNHPETHIKWLKAQILFHVNRLLSLSKSENLPIIIDGWGAVLHGGHGQSLHVHPGSIFAGVYYVTAPKEVGQNGSHDGCLAFIDPRSGANMAQAVRGKSVYGENFEVCPSESGGFLVIFPSWLMHEVKPLPLNATGPRIAISFNVIFSPISS